MATAAASSDSLALRPAAWPDFIESNVHEPSPSPARFRVTFRMSNAEDVGAYRQLGFTPPHSAITLKGRRIGVSINVAKSYTDRGF